MSAAISRFRQRLYEHSVASRFWIGPEMVAKWAKGTHLFFVLGMGRSGTSFLAHLLGKDPKACVVHEPVRRDFEAYQRAFHSQVEAERYVGRFRSKEIFLRASRKGAPTYGEINSILRRHVYALRQAFPHAVFLHLVRDGRDVVRSMMARATMTPEDPNTSTIRPHSDDLWSCEWPQMDRFSRLCWYWSTENAFVREAIGVTIRFEELLSDYEYFAERLLEPCGVRVARDDWEVAVSRPRNKTSSHRIADSNSWSPNLKQAFKRICGEEMLANGYELD